MKWLIQLFIIFCLIGGCVSCQNKGGEKVIDMNEIMKNIPSEYKKKKEINGIMRDTYFFFSWTGYDHPIKMTNPTSYMETQTINQTSYAYYEASVETSQANPLLIFVEKFIIKRVELSIDENQLNKDKVGDLFYLSRKDGDKILLDRAIHLDETFQIYEYIHIVLDNKHKLIKSELVRKCFEWSYSYEYDKKGELLRVVMQDDTGKTILEKGKGL